MVFPCENNGKEMSKNIVEAVLCGDEEGSKKTISEVDEEALPLEESNNKVSI